MQSKHMPYRFSRNRTRYSLTNLSSFALAVSFLFTPTLAVADVHDLFLTGRIVKADGKPVSGPTSLRVELCFSKDCNAPIYSTTINDTPVKNGVFQISLGMNASTFSTAFPGPATKTYYRITDMTNSPNAPFDTQAIAALPYAYRIPINTSHFQWNSSGELTLVSGAGNGGSGSFSNVIAASSSASTTALVVSGASGQTSNLADFKNYSGSTLFSIDPSGIAKFLGPGTSYFMGLKAATGMTANVTYTFPAAPVAGAFLQTDANGNLSWANTGGSMAASSVTGLTAGSIAFADATGLTQSNAQFFWDNTNNRLGIGTNSPATSLHVSGDARFQNIRTYGMTRTLPTTTNDYINLGSLAFTSGGANLTVKVSASGFSASKTYFIALSDDQTSGGWKKVAPLVDSYASGDDFALDINVSTTTATLRLRRTGGTTAGTAYVAIYHEGNLGDTFTASSTTGSVAAPAGYLNTSLLTMNPTGIQTYGKLFLSADPASALEAATKQYVDAAIGTLSASTISGTSSIATSGNISTTGTLGIGTTSPGSKVEIKGAGATSATSALNVTDSAGSSKFFVRNDGNIGVGTTSPSEALEVNGKIQITSGPQLTSRGLEYSSGSNYLLFNDANPRLAVGTTFNFAYADANISRLGAGKIGVGTGSQGSSAGTLIAASVGIGATSPGALLQVGSTYDTGSTAGASISAAYNDISAVSNNGTLNLITSDTATQDYGGAITFGGAYNTTANYTKFAGIKGAKENSTAGNYAGYLSFFSRANGSAPAERMRITSAGNVGIGTTSPATKLHVSGAVSGGAGSIFTLENSNTAASDQNRFAMITGADTGTGINKGTVIFTNASGRAGWADYENRALTFWTGSGGSSAERVRIDNSGNVGIGTTSPVSTLHVAGNSYTSGSALAGSFAPLNSGVDLTIGNGAATYLVFDNTVASGGTGNAGFLGGNVGIGTTSPAYPLDVNGAIRATGAVYAGTGSSYLTTSSVRFGNSAAEIGASGTVINYGANTTTTGHQFRIGSSAAMTVDSAGNVGIGTTGPSALLHAVGTGAGTMARFEKTSGNGYAGFQANAASTVSLDFGYNGVSRDTITGGSGSGNDLVFVTNNGNAYFTVGTGNVGIGTTSPGYKLDVNGDTRVTGSSQTCIIGAGSGANCTSDIRLKENIIPIENALEKILEVRGVEFDWNDKARSPGKHDRGVIAQDVQKVFPESVKELSDSGYLTVDYASLVAPLIEALREVWGHLVKTMRSVAQHDDAIAKLQDDNKVLKDDNKVLKDENKVLKDQVEMLREEMCNINPNSKMCAH